MVPLTVAAGGPYGVQEGSGVTLTATPSDANAAVTYTWTVNGHTMPVVSDMALSLTWPQLAALGVTTVGDYPVAVHAGDAGGRSGDATAVLAVSAASTAALLDALPTDAVYGRPEAFVVTLRYPAGVGTPVGNVTFAEAGTTLATVAVDGTGHAEWDTDALVVVRAHGRGHVHPGDRGLHREHGFDGGHRRRGDDPDHADGVRDPSAARGGRDVRRRGRPGQPELAHAGGDRPLPGRWPRAGPRGPRRVRHRGLGVGAGRLLRRLAFRDGRVRGRRQRPGQRVRRGGARGHARADDDDLDGCS